MRQRKIIWAFDPYTDIVETWKRSEEALNLLNVNEEFVIEPVYVLGSDMLRWIGNVTPTQITHIRPYVEKTFAQRLDQVKVKGLKAPEIIESLSGSRRSDIDNFIEYINKQKPELLVLNTHARKGLSRLYVGSFAEYVSIHCEVPTLFINPKMGEIKKLDHVLFPTDFSKHSKKVYKKFLKLYGKTIKDITIFNKILRPINAFAEAGVTALGGAWVAPEQYLEDERKLRIEDGKKWQALTSDAGVNAILNIDDSLGDVVDAIHDFEQQNSVDLIAMSSESGPIESVVIGSIARGVIRTSTIPVMICHGFSED